MPRFGWSSGGQLSPYSSNLGPGGVPAVTENDYAYITSEDLETHGLGDGGPRYGRDPRDSGSTLGRTAPETPEDDILLVKNEGVVYPERFPAYSIGDGQLLVGDVRERIQMVIKLSDRRASRAKLWYKGRLLKDPRLPVRDYGIKNNSEIMVVLGGSGAEGSSDEDGSGVAKKKKPAKKRRGKKKPSERSPQDSGSNVGSNASSNVGSNVGSNPGLEVPQQDGGGRPQSPGSGVSGFSAASSAPGGPIDQLNTISAHFTNTLLPPCQEFDANPPSDPKKRLEEHRRLSETLMQHVLLKLDGVDTGGDEDVRAKRKELVGKVQDVFQMLDARLRS